MASYKNYSIGDRIWIPHEDDAWLAGRVEKVSQSMLEVMTERGAIQIRPSSDPSFRYEPCGSHVSDNIENLVDLDELSEGAILHHIRKRYKKRVIYTYVVAVNPFEKLDIYNDEEIERAQMAIHLYPHVFVTASLAYKQLQSNRKDQSVLISGESGAGKTETTKKVLSFLSKVAPSSKPKKLGEPGIEDKILQSNPLLEALGNAKTLRNNNSSRFGKWMKIEFDQSFCMQGCEIINYLLEKTRVVQQSRDERNYHIFYQFLSTKDPKYRTQFRLKGPLDYHYLSQSGCETIPGVSDADEFLEVLEAMKTLQFPPDTIDEIFQILVIVLNLGNLYFMDGSAASSTGDPNAALGRPSQETLVFCSELLQVESPMILFHSLTERVMQMGKGSMVSIKLNKNQAEDTRDNLAKTLYSNLFDYIIKWVNTTLKTAESTFYSIGILDIFGFEVFPTNSFEQLCINYANEKLQFHFNEVIFHEETAMYLAEGISLEEVVFEDNAQCVSLIEAKPFGIFSLLDEECSLGKATDITFINKLEKTFGIGKQYANNFFVKHRTKQEIFSVKHFAGGVEYNVTDFLEKNRDTMSATTLNMLKLSQLPLIHTLFDDEDANSVQGGNSPARGGLSKAASTNLSAGDKPGVMNRVQSAVTSTSANKLTLGGKFRGQLIGLVNNLYKTEPHFIRCVKPNQLKAPQMMDGVLTLRQLRYAGLFEAIRIRKSGYAYRASHRAFADSYQLLVDDLKLSRLKGAIDDIGACEEILENMTKEKLFPREVWAIGHTKVFLKANLHRTYLERRKATRVQMFVIAIQARVRGYIVREKYKKVRSAWLYERNRQAALAKKLNESATLIQKHVRRYLVMSSLLILRNLVRLRRYVKRQDVTHIRSLVKDLEAQIQILASDVTQANSERLSMNNGQNPIDSSGPVSILKTSPRKNSPGRRNPNQILKYHVRSKIMDKSMNILTIKVFQREIMYAKTFIKLHELQQQYLIELRKAFDEKDVMILNQLIMKADRLDMASHEFVLKAKLLLSKLYEKRNVIQQMIRFLQNEQDDDLHSHLYQNNSKKSFVSEDIDGYQNGDESKDDDEFFGQAKMKILLEKARELGVDSEFVAKVDRVYISTGPRIEARSLLRRAIETVDRYGIIKGIEQVEFLQLHHPNFAGLEIRAANAMLRLLDFDRQLRPWTDINNPSSPSNRSTTSAGTSSTSHEMTSITPNLSRMTVNELSTVDDDDEDDLLSLGPPKPRASMMKPPPPPPLPLPSIQTSKSKPYSSSSMDAESEAPRLTKELIELCDEISILSQFLYSDGIVEAYDLSFEDMKRIKQRLKEIKTQLKSFAKTAEGLETIIRSYKWTKLLCPWKFPECNETMSQSLSKSASNPSSPSSKRSSPSRPYERLPVRQSHHVIIPRILNDLNISMPTSVTSSLPLLDRNNDIFYGLSMNEARANTFIIKLLHKEIDAVVGDIPASIQTAMTDMHLPTESVESSLPYAVTSALQELDEVDRYNQMREMYLQKMNKAENSRRLSIKNTLNNSPSGSPGKEKFMKSSPADKGTTSPLMKSSGNISSLSPLQQELQQSRNNLEKQKKLLETTKQRDQRINSKKMWK